MFRPAFGVCSECNNNRLIVIKAGLCKKCNDDKKRAARGNGEVQERSNILRQKVYSDKKSGRNDISNVRAKPTSHGKINKRKTKSKPTGELVVFREIFEERDPWCEWCGAGIIDFSPANYHHVKPKSRFPELRLDKTNIVKICFTCHFNEHNKGKEK